MNLVRVDDQVLTCRDFITELQLLGKFDQLLDDVLKIKLVAKAARDAGVVVTDEEIQTRADQIRRVMGLHRAADMFEYLESIKATVDQFSEFVAQGLYYDKQAALIADDAAVKEYFKLNLPKFDAIEVAHIVMGSEGAAREVFAIVEEDPGEFGALAAEHSLAETKYKGGSIGRIRRGSLTSDAEAKIFNSEIGTPSGPFETLEGTYEIFVVQEKHPATLDEPTQAEIRRLLIEEWTERQLQATSVEML